MRLCGRSPKDGEPFDRQAVWNDYMRTLQQLTAHTDAATFDECAVDANTRLRAITHASARSFRCRSGNDVMSLLLTSERVHRYCGIILRALFLPPCILTALMQRHDRLVDLRRARASGAAAVDGRL